MCRHPRPVHGVRQLQEKVPSSSLMAVHFAMIVVLCSGDAEKAEEVEKVDEIDTGPKYNDDWSTYYESESEPETVRHRHLARGGVDRASGPQVKPVPQGSTDGSVLFFWSPDYDSKRKKGI